MLGIRRFKGVAIDLFQGDLTLFSCDAVLDAARLGPELAGADSSSKRHVAVANALDPEAAFRGVKSYFEGERAAPRGVQRLSFVLSSLDQYYEFQDVLFRTFPDET